MNSVTTLTAKQWPSDFCVDIDLSFPSHENGNKYGYAGAIALMGNVYISATHTNKLLSGTGFGLMMLIQSNGLGPYYATAGFADPGSRHKASICYKSSTNVPSITVLTSPKVATGYLYN